MTVEQIKKILEIAETEALVEMAVYTDEGVEIVYPEVVTVQIQHDDYGHQHVILTSGQL